MDPPPQKKVADRPHWIAIAVGVFSPTVGICALIISLQSLHTSERSLEIGQRAYLAAYEARLQVWRLPIEKPPASCAINRYIKVRLGFWATIKNLGNTPAQQTTIVIHADDLPKGWEGPRLRDPPCGDIDPDDDHLRGTSWSTTIPFGHTGDIAPKSDIHWRDYLDQEFSEDAIQWLRKSRAGFLVAQPSFTILFTWRDVFGKTQSIQWRLWVRPEQFSGFEEILPLRVSPKRKVG